MESQDAPKVLYINSNKTKDCKPGMVFVIHFSTNRNLKRKSKPVRLRKLVSAHPYTKI